MTCLQDRYFFRLFFVDRLVFRTDLGQENEVENRNPVTEIIMKSSVKTFKVFITGICVCVLSFSFLFSSANNIRINGTVQVSQGTGDTLVLSFPLRWDNSWRDQFNWDAAWVFLKYKSGTGAWNHINLCAGGHRFMNGSGLPVPFDCMAGNTGSSTVGLFIYRSALEAGNTPEIVCHVKCLKSSAGGLTAEQFQKHDGFILAQAVEMVYVPYGTYYVGDGSCANRFAGMDKNPVLIDNEDAITAATVTKVCPVTNNVTGSAQNIAVVYPKGYKGFYMMKYEVSQEQWVYFLNTLTYAQQQERVPGLMALKKGEYISGDKTTPGNRNGIVVAEPSYISSTAIFANNLHNDDSYSQESDGKTIACNYLSPSDMLAYCSWAGLRPMSELEYEKACRQSYPELAIQNEYAWHDNSISGRLGAVSNGGMRNERSGTTNANVNAGNAFGPVRCGLFATGSSTQRSAGATFWGGMELSGNLKEMCYNLAYTGFNGSTMGTGDYNLSLWSVTPAHFGVKGGGFSSPDSLLRVSDRTEMTGYFTDFNKKDSTVGFRGVRYIDSGSVAIQGGTISLSDGSTACLNQSFLIEGPNANVPGISDLSFTYIWYADDRIVPDETAASLSYQTLTPGIHTFKRKAICALGEAFTNVFTLNIVNTGFTLNADYVSLNLCNTSDKTVTATAVLDGGSFEWYYKGNKLPIMGNTYVADRSHFGEDTQAGGLLEITCRYVMPTCQGEHHVTVNVASDNQPCPATVQDGDGNEYPVVKIGCYCWMGANINVGTRIDGLLYGSHYTQNIPGIQKICYDDNDANCSLYGGFYIWQESLYGEKTDGKKMSGSYVQGICPEGWHVPDRSEWNFLMNELGGMSIAGMEMKSVSGWFDGGNGSNSSGFNAIPTSYYNSNWSNSDSGKWKAGLGKNTMWWCASSQDSWQLSYGTSAIVNSGAWSDYFFHNVRCVMN